MGISEREIGMERKNREFLWCDRWCIEDNLAWAVSGHGNVLFSIDMLTDHCKAVVVLSDCSVDNFRLNSNCIKSNTSIFCMPNYGNCIYCYDLLTNNIKEIEINNPNQVVLGIGDFWVEKGTLWAVSVGLRQVIEIDINEKRICNYYNITDQQDEVLAKSVKQGNCIYIVSASKSIVYEFNTRTKEVKINQLPIINKKLRTISVDENKFWLSGYNREIYLWEKGSSEVKILDQFPTNFGIYNFDGKKKEFLNCLSIEYDTFAFLESVNIGNYIWFIPFQTNQILYVNKNTNRINVFEIEEERENEHSIKIENREMNCKYILQYVYQDRYIGLYSLKNEIVLEIDTKTLGKKERYITSDITGFEKKLSNRVFRETLNVDRALYEKLFGKKVEGVAENNTVGEKIYTHI